MRGTFASVLSGLGTAVESFTNLVEAEAQGDTSVAKTKLEVALDAVRASFRRLAGLMKIDADETGLWLVRESMLSAIEKIIAELDLTSYINNRDRWRASQLGRALPAGSIGPRIRSPWGLLAQQRLRARATVSRQAHPAGSHQVTSDETTVLIPALDPRSALPTP